MNEESKKKKKDFLSFWFFGMNFRLVPKILDFCSLLTLDLGLTELFSFSFSLSVFKKKNLLKMFSQFLTVSILFLKQKDLGERKHDFFSRSL